MAEVFKATKDDHGARCAAEFCGDTITAGEMAVEHAGYLYHFECSPVSVRMTEYQGGYWDDDTIQT